METNFTGNRIATARKKMNMSQAQLAQHLFISPQAVGKWERGESIPDIITVSKLADVLGVDLNYFSERPSSARNGEAAPLVQQAVEVTSDRPRNKLSRDLSRFRWVDADLSGLKDLHEKLSEADLRNCKFIGSDLSGLMLKKNHVEGCDFRGSKMNGSRFHASHLVNDQFNDCVLVDAEFIESVIKGCDLSGADLTGVTLRSSSFHKNTISNAVLHRTTFQGTEISDVVFEGEMQECSFENCAFSKVTFQNSTLLNTFFKSKSVRHIKFIGCKADRMTYEFLKNGKADVSEITVV